MIFFFKFLFHWEVFQILTESGTDFEHFENQRTFECRTAELTGVTKIENTNWENKASKLIYIYQRANMRIDKISKICQFL